MADNRLTNRQIYICHTKSQLNTPVWASLRSPNYATVAFAWTNKKRSLRNEKLKANRVSETEEQRTERLRIRCENEKIENHEKQNLTTVKILKRGDNNELERNLRLEKVVSGKQLWLAVDRTRKKDKTEE